MGMGSIGAGGSIGVVNEWRLGSGCYTRFPPMPTEYLASFSLLSASLCVSLSSVYLSFSLYFSLFSASVTLSACLSVCLCLSGSVSVSLSLSHSLISSSIDYLYTLPSVCAYLNSIVYL